MIPDTERPSDLLAFIRHWLGYLASDDYDAAVAALDAAGWTAEQLRAAIERGLSSPVIATNPSAAIGSDRASVVPLIKGQGYSVFHAIPVNGKWSDLSAQFTFTRRLLGLHVALDDVHVL